MPNYINSSSLDCGIKGELVLPLTLLISFVMVSKWNNYFHNQKKVCYFNNEQKYLLNKSVNSRVNSNLLVSLGHSEEEELFWAPH